TRMGARRFGWRERRVRLALAGALRCGAHGGAMDFTFTDEQEELRRAVRSFATRELAPRAREFERTGEFPWDTWRKMGEMGLFGLRAPAEYGGPDTGAVTQRVAVGEAR